MKLSAQTQRPAAFVCVYTIFFVLISAVLISAAVLVHAPLIALPTIATACIVLPLMAAHELSQSVVVAHALRATNERRR